MQTNWDVQTTTPSCFLTFSCALKGHITDKTLESANSSWQNMPSSYFFPIFAPLTLIIVITAHAADKETLRDIILY